jgi:hypothetical protein
MTGDHPTDWASKYVKAAALREAAARLRVIRREYDTADWLEARADEIEQP